MLLAWAEGVGVCTIAVPTAASIALEGFRAVAGCRTPRWFQSVGAGVTVTAIGTVRFSSRSWSGSLVRRCA